MCTVVVLAVNMPVRLYGRMDVGLAEEHDLAFGLRNRLTPQVSRECGGGGAHDTDKVVLSCLDRLFGDVTAMIVGEYELVCHARQLDFRPVCFQNFVVQNLMFGYDTVLLHPGEYFAPGYN